MNFDRLLTQPEERLVREVCRVSHMIVDEAHRQERILIDSGGTVTDDDKKCIQEIESILFQFEQVLTRTEGGQLRICSFSHLKWGALKYLCDIIQHLLKTPDLSTSAELVRKISDTLSLKDLEEAMKLSQIADSDSFINTLGIMQRMCMSFRPPE